MSAPRLIPASHCSASPLFGLGSRGLDGSGFSLSLGHRPPGLENHPDRSGEFGEARFVRLAKARTVSRVEEFGDGEHAVTGVSQRHAENGARSKSGRAVDLGVELGVSVGVVDPQRFARGRDVARDAQRGGLSPRFSAI